MLMNSHEVLEDDAQDYDQGHLRKERPVEETAEVCVEGVNMSDVASKLGLDSVYEA